MQQHKQVELVDLSDTAEISQAVDHVILSMTRVGTTYGFDFHGDRSQWEPRFVEHFSLLVERVTKNDGSWFIRSRFSIPYWTISNTNAEESIPALQFPTLVTSSIATVSDRIQQAILERAAQFTRDDPWEEDELRGVTANDFQWAFDPQLDSILVVDKQHPVEPAVIYVVNVTLRRLVDNQKSSRTYIVVDQDGNLTVTA